MNIKEYIPGFLIILIIGVLSYFISTFHASFDSLVISIIIGMFTGNLIGRKDYFMKGVEGSIKVFLPAGIALYGTQLVFKGLNPVLLAGIFLVFVFVFGLTLFASNLFGLNRKLSILLASGLAVCGASAIAIISPLIGARREDTSISILSVMMLGLTGMILYPVVYDLFSMTGGEYTFLTGTTLPMLGQVRVAAGNVSPEALAGAMEIKLVRISFLFFLVSIAVLLSGKEGKKVSIPWFVVLFGIFALIANFLKVPGSIMQFCKTASSFLLSSALAAIGFTVDFDSIIEDGLTPLGVVFVSWIAAIIIIHIAGYLL
jgi:uncharacterized integral membrane protein (TIGR00698 family)